ncbi:hypothetical protein C0Q70_04062 [Pomacea canaliculata]|uniref:Uncharacterized protein n=1 Tax=Pomacea canaliculata TaxID=400727 RepID=A0A2T7PUH9_POMCA|nr:hypothetical protein C0Q70_04062 [Pomacea canaliculata]
MHATRAWTGRRLTVTAGAAGGPPAGTPGTRPTPQQGQTTCSCNVQAGRGDERPLMLTTRKHPRPQKGPSPRQRRHFRENADDRRFQQTTLADDNSSKLIETTLTSPSRCSRSSHPPSPSFVHLEVVCTFALRSVPTLA